MVDAATAATLQTAAAQLQASARSHKRAADHHRRQARDQMAELDKLRRLCDQHGITLRLTTDEDPRRESRSP